MDRPCHAVEELSIHGWRLRSADGSGLYTRSAQSTTSCHEFRHGHGDTAVYAIDDIAFELLWLLHHKIQRDTGALAPRGTRHDSVYGTGNDTGNTTAYQLRQ